MTSISSTVTRINSNASGTGTRTAMPWAIVSTASVLPRAPARQERSIAGFTDTDHPRIG